MSNPAPATVTRTLVGRHLLAVLLVAAMALGGQAMLQRALDLEVSQRDSARAGERLTGLCDRIGLAGQALLLASSPEVMARQRERLQRALDAFGRSRDTVTPSSSSAEAGALHARLQAASDELSAVGWEILSPEADPSDRSILAQRLQKAAAAYRGTMTQVFNLAQAEADQRTLLYRHLSLALVAGLLLALLLETSLVFRPAVRRIGRTIRDLESVRGQLRENLDALKNSHQLIKADLKAAARIQRSLLPLEPPQIPGVEVAWIFDSCDEVAGDMFNVFRLDEDHVGFYILDVCGHGVQAAMLSVSVTRALTPLPQADGLIKRRVPGDPSYYLVPPADVARELNRRFPVMEQSDQFFTFLYGLLELSTGRFTYVRAGHPGPLFVSGGRTSIAEGPVGLPIGIEEDELYQEQTVFLAPGDQVLFYTDGVVDLQDCEGGGFGKARMLDALAENSDLGVTASLYTLRQRMAAFANGGRRRDDISVLGIGRLAAPLRAAEVALLAGEDLIPRARIAPPVEGPEPTEPGARSPALGTASGRLRD